MPSSLTIGGFPCRMTQPLVWTLYMGVQHRVASIPMDPDDAEAILGLDELVDVEFRGRSNKAVSFRKVVIVGEGPSPDPFTRVVEFADQRYFWPKLAFSQNFNETVSSVTSRTVSPAGTPVAIQQNVNDLKFAAYSINPDSGEPWKAYEVIRAVFSEVVGEENKDWLIAPEAIGLPESQVQDLDMPGVGDSGMTAIAKALSLVPGLGVYQNYDGVFVVDSKIPGRADQIIDSLGPPLISGQTIRKVNRSHDRARKYRAFFPMEIGVRADFITRNDSVSKGDFWFKNVAATVLPVTTLPDGSTVGPGTTSDIEDIIETFATYMRSVSGLSAILSIPSLQFSFERVLKFYLWGLNSVYTRGSTAGIEADQVIASMISEVQNSLRIKFQLNPEYANAAVAFIPKVVGIVDPETGTEAQAIIYGDYATRPSAKAFLRRAEEDKQRYSVNHFGGVQPVWQAAPGLLATGTKLDGSAGAKRAPAIMSRPNRAGVFEVQFRRDPWGNENQIVPTTIDESTIPSADYASQIATFNRAALRTEHQMNIVFAAVPAPVGRGDDGLFRHLCAIDIVPDEAAEKLGLSSVGPVLGAPVMEETIGIQPAKFAYSDDAQPDIRSAFGLNDNTQGISSNFSGPFLKDTLPGPVTPVNLEDLQELAVSSAARYYQSRLDRYSGVKTVPLRSDLVPVGEISAISHILMPKGALFSTVSCSSGPQAPLNPLSLLPGSVRRTLLKTVNPTGG